MPGSAPYGAPADVADYWPEPVEYGYAPAPSGRVAMQTRAGPEADYYDDDYVDAPAYAPVPDERSRQEWQNWQDWQDWQREVAPPPLMHPDHPSAPVPMVQFPGRAESRGDHYQGELSGRFPGPGTVRFRSGRSLSTDSQWTEQVLTLADGQAAQIAQEAEDHALAIRDAAERDAATITQQATGQASAIREDAQREAAVIREAAEREAADLRAKLDTMWTELGRMAAYVTENLSTTGPPAIAPAPPDARPALHDSPDALPGPWAALTRPAAPATRPARPDPGNRPGGPAGPRTTPGRAPAAAPARAPAKKPASDGPARQTATPAKPGQTQGRQRRAGRIATAGTAALVSIAALGAVTYTGIHGFSFFVFRESGQGETPGNFTDAKFLARQAAAQQHDSAPKGRHHKAAGSQ